MTTGDVLETLRVVIEADKTRLTQGLTAGVQESRQAGQQMGQSLRTGLAATLPALGGVGAQAGQQFGDGFTRDASGRLRDARGKFVKSGQELGQSTTEGLAQGLRQGAPAVDSAFQGITARLSGGGMGGRIAQGLTAGLSAGITSSGILGQLGGLTAGFDGVTGAMGGVLGTAGPLAAGVAGVTAAVTASAVAANHAVNEYSKLEYGIAKVATLTDKTPEQLRGTGEAVLNMSRDLGMSFQDLNAGLYDVLGAGVRGTEDMGAALTFVNDAAKLAIAGATDTAVATDALTSVMNAYKLSASDTKSVSDSLFQAVKDGKMSFNELAGSVGMVTAIAADANVPLQTVLASLATMTANGVQASSSIDYLRSLIVAITNPTEKAAGVAKTLGIEFNAQALKSKGLVAVLQDVMRATNGNKDQMGDLLGGVEAMTAATSIASGEFDRMKTNLDNQAKSAGATEEAYSKLADTIKKKNDELAANWAALWVKVGEAFAPTKLALMNDLNEILDQTIKVVDELKKMKEGVAAYGATEYSLSSWLERSGLRESDLTPEEKKQVQALLKQMQAQGNRGAQNSAIWGNLGLPGVGAFNDRNTAEAIGRLGVVLGGIQATVSQRARVIGPEMGGEGVDMSTLPAEAGKFGYAFIHALTKTFTNDSRVASDCAIIAYELLNKLGVKIKGTAVQNAWVPTLEKNAKASGFQEVALKDARPGDLVIFKSGNGIRYGAGSGMHAGLIAGMKGRELMVADNPGTQPDGSDGITRVRAIGRDAPQATIYRAPVSPFAAGGTGNTPPPTDKPTPPVTAEQIIKAQRLTAALEKAQEALKKDPGSVPLTQAVITATRALNTFKDASDGNKEALAALQREGVKTSGTYIATSADLARYGSDALRLFKDLQKAQESGSAAERSAAEQNVATWIGTSKARQAVFTAEGAAFKVREQQREEAAREAEQGTKEEERRTKEAATRRARVAEAARQGNIKLAEQEAARLEQMRENDLRRAGDNAEKRRAVELRYGNEIYLARKAIAEKIFKDAMGDAARGPAQEKEQAEQIARNNRTAALEKAEADKNGRLIAARKAVEQEDKAARDKARQQGEQDFAAAEKFAAEQEARDERLAAIRARVADERRKLSVDARRADLAETEELNRKELAGFKGTAAERLKIVQRQAKDEYDARMAVAREVKRVALDESARGNQQNRAARDAAINTAFTQERARAQVAQDAAVQAAVDGIQREAEAVTSLTDRYRQAREELKKKADGGTLTAQDLTDYARQLAGYWADAGKAGIKARPEIVAAHAAAKQLAGTAPDLHAAAVEAQVFAGTFDNVSDSLSRAAGTQDKVTVSIQDAIANIPQGEEAVAVYVAALGQLEDQGLAAAGSVRAVNAAITEQARKLQEQRDFYQSLAPGGFDRFSLGGANLNGPDSQNMARPGIPALVYNPEFLSAEQGEQDRRAAEALTRELEGMDEAQLAVALSAAQAAQQGARITAIYEEQRKRVEAATQAQRDYFQSFKAPSDQKFDMSLPLDGSQNMAQPGSAPFNWDSDVGRVLIQEDQAAATKKLREEVEALGDAELETGRAQAIAADDGARLSAIIAEQTRRVEARTQAQRDYYQSLKAGDFSQWGGLNTEGSQNMTQPGVTLVAWAAEAETANQQFSELKATLDSGEESLEAFSQRAGSQTEKWERMAVAAERNNTPALAAFYRDLAANLRNLIPVLEDTAEQFITLAEGAASVGDGLASIFNGFGMGEWGKLSSSIGGLVKTVQDGQKAFSAIGPAFSKSFGAGLGAVGSFLGMVGAGINLVGQIGDAILNLSPAFRAWKKNLLEVAELQNKAASMNGGLLGNPYAAALKEDAGKREQLANAGFWKRAWWAISGSAPKVMEEGAARLKSQAAEIFADLGQTISNTLEGSLMDAFLKADFSGVEEAMKKALDTFVVKAAIQAVIKKSQLTQLVEAYADEAARGGDTSDEAAAIRAEMSNVNRAFQGIAPGLPGYGSGADGGVSGGGQSGSLFGNAPGVQLGIPRIEVTLPPDLLRPLTELGPHISAFGGHVGTFGYWVQRLMTNGGNGNPPPLSGNGAL